MHAPLRKLLHGVSALLIGPAVAAASAAQDEDFSRAEDLLPPDASDGARFGTSLAQEAGGFAIGAPPIVREQLARVFVYEDAGSAPAVLTPFGLATTESFGHAIAWEDDCLVVGAPLTDAFGADAGAVFVFRRQNGAWIDESVLISSDRAAGDRFGESVALENGVLWVGAPSADARGRDSGAVYRFGWDGTLWTQQEKLLGSDTVGRDFFGAALAADGANLLVGAPFDDDQGLSSGSAYLFTESAGAWSESAKWVGSGAGAQDLFGRALTLHGDLALVGAPGNPPASSEIEAGAAYAFERLETGWTQTARWAPDAAVDGAAFGAAVAVDESWALVGSPGPSGAQGEVSAFRRVDGAWSEERQLLDGSGFGESDRHGASLAMDEQRVLVGAPGVDRQGVDAGAVAHHLRRSEPEGPILVATPPLVRPGQTLTLELRGGPANGRALILQEFGPGFLRVLGFAKLDEDGTWSARIRVHARQFRGDIDLKALVWSRRPFDLQQTPLVTVTVEGRAQPGRHERDGGPGRDVVAGQGGVR